MWNEMLDTFFCKKKKTVWETLALFISFCKALFQRTLNIDSKFHNMFYKPIIINYKV